MRDDNQISLPVSIGRAGASRKHDRWFSSRISPSCRSTPSGVNGSMRPHDNDEDRGAEPRGRTRARSGVARRGAGGAAARGRPPAPRVFPPALPHAGAARRALEEGGRQLGLRPGPVRTLCALLALYRGWGLRRPPVLAATNAAIARAAGCDERTVQKHLALLRARGLVLVDYGPHNRRRPEPDAGPGDPAGIDLRPAPRAAPGPGGPREL